MSESIDHTEIKQHYEREDLLDKIRQAVSKLGPAGKTLSLADLAPLDQFHSRGLAATKEIASALEITSTSKVLDIGSGLGGPARYLASKFGCSVSGIDLTQSYVDAAKYLTERTGLGDKVSFQCANALSLPFADATFDIAWTQHVAMNISNRADFYAESYRVLKPGGQLAIYDVIAGDQGPVHFPVPWSTTAETSFLMTEADMKALLEKQGYTISTWINRTESAIEWFSSLQKTMSSSTDPTTPQMGLNTVVGEDFKIRSQNLQRSLKEGRAAIIETIAIRS